MHVSRQALAAGGHFRSCSLVIGLPIAIAGHAAYMPPGLTLLESPRWPPPTQPAWEQYLHIPTCTCMHGYLGSCSAYVFSSNSNINIVLLAMAEPRYMIWIRLMRSAGSCCRPLRVPGRWSGDCSASTWAAGRGASCGALGSLGMKFQAAHVHHTLRWRLKTGWQPKRLPITSGFRACCLAWCRKASAPHRRGFSRVGTRYSHYTWDGIAQIPEPLFPHLHVLCEVLTRPSTQRICCWMIIRSWFL